AQRGAGGVFVLWAAPVGGIAGDYATLGGEFAGAGGRSARVAGPRLLRGALCRDGRFTRGVGTRTGRPRAGLRARHRQFHPVPVARRWPGRRDGGATLSPRSEEHTSELH